MTHQNAKSPLRAFIKQIETEAIYDGHLSLEYGFLPARVPQKTLPATFKPWEDFAEKIQDFLFVANPQAVLEQMPLLQAEQLEDEYLPYASTLLSLLAHAYWRLGNSYYTLRMSMVSAYLPESILTPWQIVNSRLGRFNDKVNLPFQNAYDLFLNNWKFIDQKNQVNPDGSYDKNQLLIENLEPLIPSFGNEAERVFYMSFVEMHLYASKMIVPITRLQDGILSDDFKIVCQELDEITGLVKLCTKAFQKISPHPNSPTYCDPVLWAKTVGIMGVPHDKYPQGGTSGTGTPLMHTLDALLERSKLASTYGQYVQNESLPKLPSYLIDYVMAIRKVSINEYLKQKEGAVAETELNRSYQALVEAYAGENGFLGVHIGKIMNYLATGTLVGRNESTSGHERYIYRKTWEEVAQDLEQSRIERITHNAGRVIRNTEELTEHNADIILNKWTRAEVACHRYEDDLWIIIGNKVFDLTSFIKHHKGGFYLLTAYAGNDVSRFFAYVQNHKLIANNKFLKGELVESDLHGEQKDLYQLWHALLDDILLIGGILKIQYGHTFSSESREQANQYSLVLTGSAHHHFVNEHLHQVVTHLERIAASVNSPLVSAFKAILDLDAYTKLSRVENCNLTDFKAEKVSANQSDQQAQEDHKEELLQRMQGFRALDTNLIEKMINTTIETMGAEAKELPEFYRHQLTVLYGIIELYVKGLSK
ncbi:MAG: cytochrome b5 domain-containing protein [Gallionella sp.]|nr:cytochrome b5 domain-containing protein [Gallionella sp.]